MEKMNTLELIRDTALYGGTVPNERSKEVADFLDNVEQHKQYLTDRIKELEEEFEDVRVKMNIYGNDSIEIKPKEDFMDLCDRIISIEPATTELQLALNNLNKL